MERDFMQREEERKIRNFLDEAIARKREMFKFHKNEELGIALCSDEPYYLHVHAGIERMAYYLGAIVKYNPNWDAEYGHISFTYNGVEVFQLWEKGVKA